MKHRVTTILLTGLLAVSLTGCGLSRKELNINMPSSGPLPAENKGTVFISSVKDSRKFTNDTSDNSDTSLDSDLSKASREELATVVGRQSNASGIRLGNLTLPKGEDVTKKMRSLVELSFRRAGYEVSNNQGAPIKAAVSVTDFWGWLTSSFAFNYGAKVGATVNLSLPDGKTTSVSVSGRGDNVGYVLKEENFREAFEPAVKDFVQNLTSELDKIPYKRPSNAETKIGIYDELKQLSELKNSGVITQQEFDEQKKKILNK